MAKRNVAVVMCLILCLSSDGRGFCQEHVTFAAPGMESHAVIGLKTRPGARDTFVLSPNGAFVAHLSIEEIPPPSHQPVLRPGYERNVERPESERRETVEILNAAISRKVAEYAMSPSAEYHNEWSDWNQRVSMLSYCDNGKYLVVSGGNGKVYVLDTGTYHPHGIIDLQTAGLPLGQRRSSTGDAGPVDAQAACAANAGVLALQLVGRFGSDVVKLFDLRTLAEISGGEKLSTNMLRGNTAVSADGVSVATVQETGRSLFTAAILELRSKSVSRNISFTRDDLNRGFPQLWFLGNSTLAVQRAGEWEQFLNARSLGGDLRGPDDSSALPATLCWDIVSGAEVGSCSVLKSSTDFGVLDVSTDGRVVLFNTGRADWCRKCNHGDGKLAIDYAQITLMNRETGQVIASSQHLPVLHHKCPVIPLFGDCDDIDETPKLLLSQDGSAVLAYWPGGNEPVLVFNDHRTF